MAENKNKEAYNQFIRKNEKEKTLFLLTEAKQDCCFVFESTDSKEPVRRLYSYKWMLSALSPVFEAMFNGDFKESTSSMDIKIDDISFEDFQMFLRCVHRRTENAELWPIRFWDRLLYIVDKYMMKEMLYSLLGFMCTHNDPITIFKWNEIIKVNSYTKYYEEVLIDERLGEFDLKTFIDFMSFLCKNNMPLNYPEKYKLIKAYIKQKGYDVKSNEMVKVCEGDSDEEGSMLKSHREIIENLLYYADVDITFFLNETTRVD